MMTTRMELESEVWIFVRSTTLGPWIHMGLPTHLTAESGLDSFSYFANLRLRISEWSRGGTYISRTKHVSERSTSSIASNSWISLGCWRRLMMSISLSTFRLSSFLFVVTTLAANVRPVLLSRHRYTRPNFPLCPGKNNVKWQWMECQKIEQKVNMYTYSPPNFI
jgi:hypothetical protein